MNVFECDPGLVAGLRAGVLGRVVQVGEVGVITCSPGLVEFDLEHRDGFGLLLLEGFLCRISEVTGRESAELLGRGDMLCPWEDDRAEAPVPVTSSHRGLTQARLAVLDRRFEESVAPWLSVAQAVCMRFLERTRWLALQLAIVQVRRIEDRLRVLLWHLADRWGRVERNGTIVCPVPLTQGLLGAMVGCQRPTVSSALAQLAAEGHVTRRPDGWVLHGSPPTTSSLEARALVDAFRIRSEN